MSDDVGTALLRLTDAEGLWALHTAFRYDHRLAVLQHAAGMRDRNGVEDLADDMTDVADEIVRRFRLELGTWAP
ncbi:MAG TPA: hypothetical protein VN962_03485 [Polyangia bacterium]|nr:hypothetical protein [Polyangia bacterium]